MKDCLQNLKSLEKNIPRSRFAEIAKSYKAGTSLPLMAVNLNGEPVYSPRACAFCREIIGGRNEALAKSCRAQIAKAVAESYRWGEGYLTSCPLGLILFAVPIVLRKKLSGGLVSGFAIFPKMRKDFPEEASENLGKFGLFPRRARALETGRRVISLKKAKEYVSFLLELGGRYGLDDLDFLKERKAKHIRQQKIAGFLEELKKENPDVSKKILDKQDEIIQKVKLGDTPGAREILNEFLGSIFFESGMNFEVMKVRVIELIVIISRAAIEAGAEARELLGLNYSYLTELNRVASLDELLDKVTQVLENFIDKVSQIKEKKKTLRVSRMREYVNQNFTRKITAGDIAGEGGLSVGRALHLFKEETGLSLTTYINKLKVDYGKYLLLNTDLSLAAVANELGFFDQSHFTKNFKRFERVTPSHYRLKYKPEI